MTVRGRALDYKAGPASSEEASYIDKDKCESQTEDYRDARKHDGEWNQTSGGRGRGYACGCGGNSGKYTDYSVGDCGRGAVQCSRATSSYDYGGRKWRRPQVRVPTLETAAASAPARAQMLGH